MAHESGPILCATRGGQGSRTVKEHAVELAATQGRELAFVFVADVTAIQPEGPFGASSPTIDAIRDEMVWNGSVLLRIAKLQAARSGVDAQLFVRDGSVLEAVVDVAREIGASLVLLGAPRGAAADIADDSPLSRLARAIRDEAGVDVQVTMPGSPAIEDAPD